ncbi:ABC transporter permease subunit [Serratia marcescens]|uniref:ABC transporter permease subunit n=1 Tax=Serratia marcescens TaxID=615 RepID=UPI000F7F6753|nr:ABC transporter permease subunit [Serratia marcescens]RTG61002.1 ABC transporter permease subunit [Serratia marcescens]
MLQFILRRLGLVIPTFIGITLLTFAFVHMIPGDPVTIMAGERGISAERHAQLMAEMGLDKPLYQQYFSYVSNVLHGDLGTSLKSRISVWSEFVPRFQATLELGFCAMLFAVLVGIPVGVLAAVKRGSVFDHTAVGISLTGYSMPIFWWGMMLIMLVSVQLNLTPVSGRISDTVFLDDSHPLTGFMLIDTLIWGEPGDFVDAVMHMILPAIVLGTIPLAVIVRMTRSSMLEVLGEDYIRAARAMGVPDRVIMSRHMLPNAMVATLTFLPFILCGSITTLTSLDFLGFGLPIGSPSLGELLLQGKNNLQAPWLGITAFLVLAVLLSLLIFIGEAVRDAFDPSKAY